MHCREGANWGRTPADVHREVSYLLGISFGALTCDVSRSPTCRYLADNNVLFEGILLKPSMVTPGAEHAKKSTPEEVSGREGDDGMACVTWHARLHARVKTVQLISAASRAPFPARRWPPTP